MAYARWHTGTKAQTLQFLREAERQSPDIPSDMSSIEHEDGINDWDVCVLECRVCGYRFTSVCPNVMSDENSECPRCGNMTADIVCEDFETE